MVGGGRQIPPKAKALGFLCQIFMKSYNSLLELRSHPEKNPFISAWDYFDEYKNRDDIFISFTKIDKIGINPQSQFNTPLGIYCYPLKEFNEWYIGSKDTIEKTIGDFAPYAGSAEYINFIKLKDKSHFINDMYTDYGSNDFDKDLKKLKNKYEDIKDGDKEEWNSFTQFAIDIARDKNPIGSIWNITRLIAQELVNNNLKATSTIWNKILRDLGYSGLADRSGKGYIHPAEPMQAVFLTTQAFELLHRIENKPRKATFNKRYLLNLINKGDYLKIKKYMEDSNIDINTNFYSEEPIIFYIIKKDNVDLLQKFLKDKKLDINIKNNSNIPLLTYITMYPKINRNDRLVLIKTILDNSKLNINIKDSANLTALNYAINDKDLDLVNLLKKAGAK